MPDISLLARMTPDDVRNAISGFRREYVRDWQGWQKIYQHHAAHPPDGHSIVQLGRILRKWQATRPLPMRRPRIEALHEPPYLDDLVTQAWLHVRVISELSVRQLDTATPDQTHALAELWDVFRNMTSRGHATCVGITKAVLLLTEGRIGPALDSTVRRKLGIRQPHESSTWIRYLRGVSRDIISFETLHAVNIEMLIPPEWASIHVGRVYDMVAGPR